jgi:hypothetical protein
MNQDSHLLFEAYKTVIENVYLPGPQSTPGIGSSNEVKSEDAEEGICGQGCTCGKCPRCMPRDEASEEEHHTAAKAHKEENPDATEDAIKHHLKKVFGDKFNEKLASKAAHHAVHGSDSHPSEDAEKKHVFTKVEKAAEKAGYPKKAALKIAGAAKAKASEDAEEDLGVDPNEAAAYDEAKKDISFDKYPFWDAYHAVKEGGWSEEDFHQWCQTVWNDGAESSHRSPVK